ncbi:MAG: UDP-N-acetylmuramoyl-tripeptide--D-alanyl-D-alanine ligase [Nitrospirae bacterium]|nr:UDP-N-acetylmuramoyl-tripeptide--D-alanyl-D-alanine ligase [Nitrospirota bacterium]
MAGLTVEKVMKATGARLLSGEDGHFSGVSIDTRTISDDELFFALKGERFDGHDFLNEALVRGRGAVIDKAPAVLPKGRAILYAADTLRALQDLACYLRKEFDIPVIAVTGSNGKTTTKEMAYAILSQKYTVLKNEGNLNNHIGLPLTLTKLTENFEAAVLEMGMNAAGEIRRLCEIAIPTHGIVTNIGTAHIGRLGSREAVRSAKLEMLPGLSVAVLNADDEFLMSGLEGFSGKIVTFGIRNEADVMAKRLSVAETGSLFELSLRGEAAVEVNLPVHGLFNVYNALAAAAVSSSLGVSPSAIKNALEGYMPFPMRFEVTRRGGITIINDAYNANPSSIKEALKEMSLMAPEGRRVAVLGDMLELGDFTEEAHRSIGRILLENGVHVFVAVGETMGLAADEFVKGGAAGSSLFRFGTSEEAGRHIMEILKEGDTALFKGSRSMKMENAIKGVKHAL